MASIILEEADKINVDTSLLVGKKILITGASGLVGIYLTCFLKKIENVSITCWINNTIPSYLTHIFEGCNIIKGDITSDSNTLDYKFDFIIHASGYGQPLKFIKDKIKTIKINTTATCKLFDCLRPEGRFLFISSSEVYNGIEHSLITEDFMGNTSTDHFRSCYIEGKKCGEAICNAYSEHGFNVKIARLSLAYGPGTRVDDERVFNTFIKKGLTEEKIILLDGGCAIRTYCYITDAVEMMLNIALHGSHNIYNVGGTSITSILGLAEIVGDQLNKEVIVPDIQKPLAGNPKIVNIDCSRYISEFNKKHFYDLNYGISKTIEWYKEILN